MPTAAEREILEYLIDTGFMDDRLVALAKQVLAGGSLSHREQAAYRHGIVERWFRLDCEQCNCTVRRVFQDEGGRQFVLDDDGDKVFGVWLAFEETEPDSCMLVPRHS